MNLGFNAEPISDVWKTTEFIIAGTLPPNSRTVFNVSIQALKLNERDDIAALFARVTVVGQLKAGVLFSPALSSPLPEPVRRHNITTQISVVLENLTGDEIVLNDDQPADDTGQILPPGYLVMLSGELAAPLWQPEQTHIAPPTMPDDEHADFTIVSRFNQSLAFNVAQIQAGAGGGTGGPVSWSQISGKPAKFAPTLHAQAHAIGGADPISADMVGLGMVDNTTDNDKPISAAAAAALNDFAAQLNEKAADQSVVHNTQAESIAGKKTFTSSPDVPPPSSQNNPVTRGYLETYVAQQVANRSGVPEAGVQDLAELAAVPASGRSDKQLRLVEDESATYRFDAQSSIAAQTNRVIAPDDGVGRWIKTSADAQDHGNLLGLQGGTPTERYHLTAAEKGRVPSANIIDALTGTGTPNNSNKFVTADWLADDKISAIDNTAGGVAVSLRVALANLFNKFGGYALRTLGGLNAAEQTTARGNVNANDVFFQIFVADKSPAGAIVFSCELPYAGTFTIADIRVTSGDAATGAATYKIELAGAQIAGAAFAASGTAATVTANGSATVSGALNDLLRITAPATADATLAKVRIRIKLVRN